LTVKGCKSGPKVRKAGAQNLAKWQADHPSGGRLQHGAYSLMVKGRYLDGRYREAKRLNAVMDSLVEGLGGASHLTPNQSLLLTSGIRPKLITLMCISDYLDKQDTLLDEGGNLLACLSKNYISFSNALRLDLLALTQMAGKPKLPDLDGYLKKHYGAKK